MSVLTYKKSEDRDTFYICDGKFACPVSLALVKGLAAKDKQAAEFASQMTLLEAKERGSLFTINDTGDFIHNGFTIAPATSLTDCDICGNELVAEEPQIPDVLCYKCRGSIYFRDGDKLAIISEKNT